MTKQITEIKNFTNGTIQPSAYNDNNHDYSIAYAKIGDNWYNYSDLVQVVGVEFDDTLCPIKDSHLNLFTQDSEYSQFMDII